jgi:hypothetical protein
MMLPQQLESALLTDDNGEEAGQLVADWIDKVGGGWGVERLAGGLDGRLELLSAMGLLHFHGALPSPLPAPTPHLCLPLSHGCRWRWPRQHTTSSSWRRWEG